MKKFEIIKKNTEFNDIINLAPYFKNKYYCLYYKDNDLNIPRFGLAVSKKCGNAVVRNKLKRQLRMIIDSNKHTFYCCDYVIVVRKKILEIDYSEMENRLLELMERLKDEKA